MSPGQRSTPSAHRVAVGDRMQRGYLYTLSAPAGREFATYFQPKSFGLIVATLLLVACSPGTSGPSITPAPTTTAATLATATPEISAARPSSSPASSPSPSPSPSRSASPASTVVVGDDGVTVELARAPQKIISLTPATSELMFALGAGDRLVGRTDYDDYPAEVAGVPAVATFEGVEIERVVDIGPDLVLAGGNNFTHDEDIKRMRDLGYAVLVLYAEDLPGVQKDIGLVGRALGELDAAEQITLRIQERIDEVTGAVAELSRSSTFYEIGNEPALYGPAPDSFVADEISIAGGEPITTRDPAVFEISLEELVTADPEVIVLGDAAYGVCPDQVVTRPGWDGITAVKNGDVRPVDDTIVTRPGPRIGDGLAALALAIHPDAQIAPPTTGSELCTSPSPAASP